jgi:hypothetical protein
MLEKKDLLVIDSCESTDYLFFYAFCFLAVFTRLTLFWN